MFDDSFGPMKALPAEKCSTSPFALSFSSAQGEAPHSLLARLGAQLKESDATPLLMLFYGDCSAHAEVLRLLRKFVGAIDWPIIWTQGKSCNGAALAGVQVFALQGVVGDLQRIIVGGRVVGSCFSDSDARHCLLGGLGASKPQESPAVQAEACFDELATSLEQAGFGFGDLARTWFYNRDLLSWYGDFNRVRSSFYSRTHFRTGSLPASTGIEGNNPAGSALSVGAWAVKPLGPFEPLSELGSPLQNPATAYGSSFSRAVEIRSAGQLRVLISGTASIYADGRSAYPDDIESQIQLTMDVIAAILNTRDMDLPHVTRAVAYCKSASYAGAFAAWLKRGGLESFPYIAVHCDICRPELLFEVELDACKKIR
jgi:enamine deaminase RidA (YjgF/YER057c/UK114 family)